jgi:hypothetical protein
LDPFVQEHRLRREWVLGAIALEVSRSTPIPPQGSPLW